jgi:hypothetical protein
VRWPLRSLLIVKSDDFQVPGSGFFICGVFLAHGSHRSDHLIKGVENNCLDQATR